MARKEGRKQGHNKASKLNAKQKEKLKEGYRREHDRQSRALEIDGLPCVRARFEKWSSCFSAATGLLQVKTNKRRNAARSIHVCNVHTSKTSMVQLQRQAGSQQLAWHKDAFATRR